MLRQNSPVLYWWCQLTHVDLYNGRKTDIVTIIQLTLLINSPTFSRSCSSTRKREESTVALWSNERSRTTAAGSATWITSVLQ